MILFDERWRQKKFWILSERGKSLCLIRMSLNIFKHCISDILLHILCKSETYITNNCMSRHWTNMIMLWIKPESVWITISDWRRCQISGRQLVYSGHHRTSNGQIKLCIRAGFNIWHVINAVQNMSRLMGKPTICIGENKGADQLRGNREADQRLCFR